MFRWYKPTLNKMSHLLSTALNNCKIQSNYILFYVWKKVSKYKLNTVAEDNFVVTSMYIHGTGQQTVHVVQHLYRCNTKACTPAQTKISVTCLWPAGDSLFPVDIVRHKWFTEMEITVPHTSIQTYDCLWCCGWEVMYQLISYPVTSMSLDSNKYQTGKQFAADANMKQAVTWDFCTLGFEHESLHNEFWQSETV